MKIGIITLPLHTNYGGILQAYALQTAIERMGHKSYIIESRYYDIPLWKIPFTYSKRIIFKILGKQTLPLFYELSIKKENSIKRKFTNPFIKKNLCVIKFYKLQNAKRLHLDAIIVGSDQIWRPKYTGEENIEDAFLRFAQDWEIKRIAYAPSFGTEKWEYSSEQTKNCAQLLQKFDAVSIREESGVELCKKHLNHNAIHVLDPTMLLNKEDYIGLFKEYKNKSNGNLLIYILDENKKIEEFIEKFAKTNHLIPFRANSKVEDKSASLDEKIQPPVEGWLKGFYDADFILTDSFHACVFSILFQKQFLVFENNKRGISRIESLLKSLNIENRIIRNDSYIYNSTQINYNDVLTRMNKLKTLSLKFLENAINK